jgi:glycosyltransferase involved in cell wall biosynthesis
MTATAGAAPRVLLVMPLGEPLGGGEMMFRQLLQHGRDGRIEWIVVFTRDGAMVQEARALGIETHLLPVGRLGLLQRRAAVFRAIARLARERQVSMIFGWMVASQTMAGPAAMLAGVPAAWYQVGLPTPDWLDRVATLFPARGIVVLSRDCAAAQARIWPHRPQRLVYPGASLERFDAARRETPAAARAALGLPADGALIGMVGRLQRWKGMHTLLDALPAVRARHPTVRAVIVGGAHEPEPDYPDLLQRQVRALGLGDVVTFAGFQPDVPRWMQAMDIVVHASDREPFGIVVPEAMALGKPVVAGAAGGPAEIITPGVDGLLAPFEDAPALAGALLRYLDDPSFAAQCGAAAARRARDFSAQRYAAALIDALLGWLGP